jgi:2-methylcitrate dehydratase PrpD
VDFPAIRAFREKVRLELDPTAIEALQAQFSGPHPRRARKVPVTVEVKTRDAVHSRSVEYSIGDPWSPETIMDDEALRAKFVSNAAGLAVASPSWRAKIDTIISTALALESLKDINTFTSMLAP